MEVLAFTLFHVLNVTSASRPRSPPLITTSLHISSFISLTLALYPFLFLPTRLAPSLSAWGRSLLCWDGAEAGPQTFLSRRWLRGPAGPSYWQRCAPGQRSPPERQTHSVLTWSFKLTSSRIVFQFLKNGVSEMLFVKIFDLTRMSHPLYGHMNARSHRGH